ncbi:glycosyltransferase family 4 protein [Actinocrinis sp.]|uniref:glycosyltransferase family 4 protein n=1 Tax=Actinocrinis sp. TaxID=1920516 RepID=UPI002D680C2E|nr:glycosyltransferase family 4 protein [Actinocrinis sp.]HZP53708.1 glycosyltransferase family 4 protein [Actinocrinis sp.]
MMAVRTVAIVAPHYPPRIGGVERYAAQIASALTHEPDLKPVVLTTGETKFRTRVSVQDGVQIVRLGSWLRLSNTPLSPLWPFQVRRWLRKLGADVVNAHAPVPGLGDIAVAVSGKRPAVLTYHSGTMHKGGADTGLADWLIGRYERHILPRVFDRADVLVPVSPVALAAGRSGAIQITPGVDVDRFTPGPPASQRPRDLIYVGRIDRTSAWKGIDVLIRALAGLSDLPDVRLKLVGDGDALPDHLELAASLGVADRVESLGSLDGADLVEAVQSAAVLVLPSLTDAEAFGMVLLEAMACATPVVASSVGGPAFVLENGESGLLVPPGDPAALEKACRSLLEDTELADRMGASGRRRVEEQFAWPALTRRYAGLFRTLTV